MIYKVTDTGCVSALFEGWEESLIWSCLQGIMGDIFCDRQNNPVSAVAKLGDFYFYAGEPSEELLQRLPGDGVGPAILVPQTDGWAGLMECWYAGNVKKTSRYAIRKEPEVFDAEHLQKFVDGLSEEYRLIRIDEEWFRYCRGTEWCRDFVSLYDSYEQYQSCGLGVLALKDGEPVAGASSYSGYSGGIEIEVVTKEEYRRRGLATACAAKLILECRKKGWYPSWDAQNLWSVGLAEKLGYHFSHEYTVYVTSERQKIKTELRR